MILEKEKREKKEWSDHAQTGKERGKMGDKET